MLWEITDVDCDRFTIRFLDLLLGTKHQSLEKSNRTVSLPDSDGQVPELLQGAVAASRHVTQNFLTGAAAVVYGLPLRTVYM